MSTFYVLPSRSSLGRQFSQMLATVFPGLHWTTWDWPELAEMLAEVAQLHADVYVIYRDELPSGLTTEAVLAAEFGAEAGDEIVEVFPGTRRDDVTVQRWQLGDSRRAAA